MDKNQLNDHRTILLRYALLQLHDEAVAEDAVQETLLAALQTGDSFRSDSALRTWLIGIHSQTPKTSSLRHTPRSVGCRRSGRDRYLLLQYLHSPHPCGECRNPGTGR